MRRILVAIVAGLVAVSAFMADGRSYYNSVRNGFGGLNPHPGMRMMGRYKGINGDFLIEENATMATAVTFDTMRIVSTNYRYQLRLANLNNKQGKTMSIKNPMVGGKSTITHPEWGLVFNYTGRGYYSAVILSCDNSTPWNDVTDERTMTVTLVECNGINRTVVASTTVKKGVSLEDDLNNLCVDVDQNSVRVSIGKDELTPVLESQLQRPDGAVMTGYLIGPGARVAVERAVLTIENEHQVVATTTSWTRETLDEYFASSIDPIEGYWSYLDRDMEEEWLRMGGRYTLAVVRADDGYDLIYIDGAQVKKSQWQPGMKKGHISRTQFTGNYDLTWIDATMEPIGGDSYATVENGVIMSLNFPEYKSQVRLAKVINPD